MDTLSETKYIIFTISSDELGNPTYDYTKICSSIDDAKEFVKQNIPNTKNIKFPSIKNSKSKRLMLICPHEDMNMSNNYTYYGKRSDIHCDTKSMYFTGYIVEEIQISISDSSIGIYGIFRVCYDSEEWEYYDFLHIMNGFSNSIDYIEQYAINNNIQYKTIHRTRKNASDFSSINNVDFIIEKLKMY